MSYMTVAWMTWLWHGWHVSYSAVTWMTYVIQGCGGKGMVGEEGGGEMHNQGEGGGGGGALSAQWDGGRRQDNFSINEIVR